MSKNQLAVAKRGRHQYADTVSILKDPARRARLQNYLDEVVNCKTKILDQQESIKTLRDTAVEELNIEPKMFSYLVSAFFNNDFDQRKAEIDKLDAALHALMQLQGPSGTDNDE